MSANPARAQRIHLIGIGGSGLSAIARLLLESGYTVSGSDRAPSVLTQELASAGARITIGQSARNIQDAQPQIVVRSSAVTDDNVEVQAALAAGIPVLKRAQFVGGLIEKHYTIAPAGTHGKTTITAMISWLLVRLGQDPSYIIGGTARNLNNRNAHAGQGRAFVIEADEYDRMFLGLNPDLIVISYLEHDHPDCFPTPQDYLSAFATFVGRLRPGGILLASLDHSDASRLLAAAPANTRAFTYGLDPQATYSARRLASNARGGFDYEAWYKKPDGAAALMTEVSLQAPGEHNVRNSLAAIAAMHQSGLVDVNPDTLRQAAMALGEFSGTGRRFDIQGEQGGVTVVDDYAHHPTEIRATLAAARVRFPGQRIWAVWQPHTYSRTLTLQNEFLQALNDADQVVITEVYPARERASDFNNFSAAQLVERIGRPNVQFQPSLENAAEVLLDQLRPGDVLLVLSAGNADQISAQVLTSLSEREGKHG